MSIQSSEIKDKVIKTLAEKNMCSIATAGKNNVDNAVVAYYSTASMYTSVRFLIR